VGKEKKKGGMLKKSTKTSMHLNPRKKKRSHWHEESWQRAGLGERDIKKGREEAQGGETSSRKEVKEKGKGKYTRNQMRGGTRQW